MEPTGESDAFDVQRFQDLLLAGVRASFQRLQKRFVNDHIYFYALCHQVDFSSIEVGVRTEVQLEEDVVGFRQALQRRHKTATVAEVRDLLRYDVPHSQLRLGPQSDESLAEAQALAAAFGERFFADIDSSLSVDEVGTLASNSPLDATYEAIQLAMQQVMLALDAEGLFGVGKAREQVVVDLMWFEGGMSQAMPYLLGEAETPPAPLNPGPVQDWYYTILRRAMQIASRLFNS